MKWDAQKPYNELPLLPPDVAKIETIPVLKAVTEARAALAALDQAVQRIPNPTVLINTLPLLEAQASSEIENIVTTADDLFRYAQTYEVNATPEVRETSRYKSAVFAGIAQMRERALTTTTAKEICSIIKGRDMGLRAQPGTYIGDPATGIATYTPPDRQDVIQSLLDNWEKFIHSEAAIDPLVKLAIQHYQFEAIHPFDDGNGRTGRIVNVLFLMHAELLQQPVLYLSRFIIANKNSYYSKLLGVTSRSAWEDWILFMLEAVRATASETLKKIDAIQALQEAVKQKMRTDTTVGPNSDLLELLFEEPYTRISSVTERCRVSRQTATKWLNELVSAGILEDRKSGRERLFINGRVIDVLTNS